MLQPVLCYSWCCVTVCVVLLLQFVLCYSLCGVTASVVLQLVLCYSLCCVTVCVVLQLGVPEKVDIPDRYVPESDDELTVEEKQFHQEKAQKLKKLLAAQRLVTLRTWSLDVECVEQGGAGCGVCGASMSGAGCGVCGASMSGSRWSWMWSVWS